MKAKVVYDFLCLPSEKQGEIFTALELGIEAKLMNDFPNAFRRIRDLNKFGQLEELVKKAKAR